MATPTAPGGRRGEGLFRWLYVLGSGCGKLPLVAGVALVLSARAVPLFAPADVPPVVESSRFEAAPPDAALIDAVLAKRAPELGLTLRRQIVHAIAEEAGRAGYDPLLILAIIDVESDFTEEAISEKGARGLMQIKPSTLHFLAEKEGLRLSREEVASDPALGVRLGIRYLRTLNDRFGDLDLALMAYNAGPTRIWQAKKAGELDTFRRYPRLVRRDFRRFREGEGLGGDWALAQREVLEKSPEEKAP
ncbi:lytic transglycosylase domain-containing protein [Archangium violaceum]|uniref:lytic transglycosylase domain-containing protein n=1 Tax=Archangium violaceum TaxID=83451 RepID=UPI00193C4611|nr:lytic transglycosylase domain-containing protein [Archangium violaceum]